MIGSKRGRPMSWRDAQKYMSQDPSGEPDDQDDQDKDDQYALKGQERLFGSGGSQRRTVAATGRWAGRRGPR